MLAVSSLMSVPGGAIVSVRRSLNFTVFSVVLSLVVEFDRWLLLPPLSADNPTLGFTPGSDVAGVPSLIVVSFVVSRTGALMAFGSYWISPIFLVERSGTALTAIFTFSTSLN